MTYEEVIKILDEFGGCCSSDKKYIAAHKAIEAIKKQMSKKPIEDGYYDEPAVCPQCGGNVINMADNDYHFQHCHYCGQALDWSE